MNNHAETKLTSGLHTQSNDPLNHHVHICQIKTFLVSNKDKTTYMVYKLKTNRLTSLSNEEKGLQSCFNKKLQSRSTCK